MLPIAGDSPPTDSTSFAQALENGLRNYGLEPREVRAAGETWPRVSRLAIDLTNAQATRALRPPSGTSPTGDTVRISEFEMRAEPLFVEKVPVQVRAHFSGAEAGFERDPKGALFLRLVRAEAGELEASITHTELEKALHTLASEAAAKQGAEVKSTSLELETPSPRTLVFRAAVTAKVFIMKTTVRVRGRIDLDDALNARLSGLAAEGEGMLSSLVESGLRPHLAKLDQQTFALGGLVAGGLRVSDVSISAGPAVRLHATFSGAPDGAPASV